VYILTVREGGRGLVDWHAEAEDPVVLAVDLKEVHRRVVTDQSRVGQERRHTVPPERQGVRPGGYVHWIRRELVQYRVVGPPALVCEYPLAGRRRG
jgi:hypothetical protein